MVEGNLFLTQVIFVEFINGYQLGGPGIIYFSLVLLNAKYCAYARYTKTNKNIITAFKRLTV